MKHFIEFGLVILALSLSSCSTNSSLALNHALPGNTVGKGPIAGAVSSLVVAASLDEQDRKVMERTSPRTVERMDRGEPLTINDVIKLSQGGVSDATILNYMQETNGTYHLSQVQIRRLQDAGVSQRVINSMIDSGQ